MNCSNISQSSPPLQNVNVNISHINKHVLMEITALTCHPTQVNAPRLNPSQTDRYSIYLPRTAKRLSWPGCLVIYTEMVHEFKDSHPSK